MGGARIPAAGKMEFNKTDARRLLSLLLSQSLEDPMSSSHPRFGCDCCAGEWNRRQFLKVTGAAGIAAVSSAWPVPRATADDRPSNPETRVAQLFKSLDERQRKLCAFPFDHPLRSKVDNNWQITEARVSSFRGEQQALIREIFLELHSPEYAEAVIKQVEHDGGFGGCSIALFGEPGQGKFEFVLTGRHVTRRCDGDSVEGTAFGGPIFYGHAAASFNEPADHPGNAYWFQAKRANELYQALDGKQRAIALRGDPRPEQGTDTVKLPAQQDEHLGLPVSDMSHDQQDLARKVMSDLLAPFRETDRQESMKYVEQAGFDKLHFAYFKNLDIGGDGVWDVWQVAGPTMIWYFRGSPHVHTWVNIRASV